MDMQMLILDIGEWRFNYQQATQKCDFKFKVALIEIKIFFLMGNLWEEYGNPTANNASFKRFE